MRKSSIRKYNLFSLCFLFFITGALNVFPLDPPTKEQIKKYRADNTLGLRIKKAERFGNHRVSNDLVKKLKYRLIKNTSGISGTANNYVSEILSPPSAWEGMPTTGDVKILVLLISFRDKPNINSKQLINNKIFGAGSQADFPLESLRSFYSRSSYGQLKISGNILGWYKTSYSREEVISRKPVSEAAARDNLIQEVISYYDAQGHDFSQYDNNGDGDIDYVAIVWSGEHEEWSDFWWAYQTSVVDRSFKVDGKSLSVYSWQWESYSYPNGIFKPSTLIHETGHALGLPDLYDYKDGVGPNGGVGGLDMMADSYGDHNCFHKFLLDWIQPVTLNSGDVYITLNPSETSRDSLLIMPRTKAGTLFGEFFMVQNRFKKGNDIEYPASGLLIWHIDSTLDITGNDFKFDNSYTDHKYIRLMEADGLEQIESSFPADEGDFYTEGNEFGPATIPDSLEYDGTNSGVFLKDIISYGETFSFSAGISILLKIYLQGERLKDKSWIIERDFGSLSFEIEFLESVDVAKYVIMRKNDIDIYREIKEILPSDAEGNIYKYNDKFIDSERKYSYKIIAYDALGTVIGISQEITI